MVWSKNGSTKRRSFIRRQSTTGPERSHRRETGVHSVRSSGCTKAPENRLSNVAGRSYRSLPVLLSCNNKYGNCSTAITSEIHFAISRYTEVPHTDQRPIIEP